MMTERWLSEGLNSGSRPEVLSAALSTQLLSHRFPTLVLNSTHYEALCCVCHALLITIVVWLLSLGLVRMNQASKEKQRTEQQNHGERGNCREGRTHSSDPW